MWTVQSDADWWVMRTNMKETEPEESPSKEGSAASTVEGSTQRHSALQIQLKYRV